MMGKEQQKTQKQQQHLRCSCRSYTSFANNLSRSYARPHNQDFCSEYDDLCAELVPSPSVLAEKDVVSILSNINPDYYGKGKI